MMSRLWVARIGGSAWVFGLSMIILMPTVTPWLRRRLAARRRVRAQRDFSDSSSRREAPAISSTAALNASSLAREGVR